MKSFEGVSTKRNTYNMTYNSPIHLLKIVSPNTFINKKSVGILKRLHELDNYIFENER